MGDNIQRCALALCSINRPLVLETFSFQVFRIQFQRLLESYPPLKSGGFSGVSCLPEGIFPPGGHPGEPVYMKTPSEMIRQRIVVKGRSINPRERFAHIRFFGRPNLIRNPGRCANRFSGFRDERTSACFQRKRQCLSRRGGGSPSLKTRVSG